MNGRLTVSVALATYQGARYLGEQLASILSQDRLPDEIVVADDGSTDGTTDLIRSVLSPHRQVALALLPSEAGHGVTANFARAISACTSDLVALCDQDDIWRHDRISHSVSAFEADPELLLMHSNARLVDSRGVPLGVTLFDALPVTPQMRHVIGGSGAFDLLLRRNLVTGATTMFRRSVFDTAAPLPTEWVHDEWIAIVAAALGRIEASSEVLIDYRQHGANQIGVEKSSALDRVRRMLASDSSRNAALARRSSILASRLADMPSVPTRYRENAALKAAFERERAALPAPRMARIPGILRVARDGRYRRFASQGRADVIRDLLQTAE